MKPKKIPNPAAAPESDDDLFWEKKVAAELGIARDRLRALRLQHLTADVHFILRQGAVVLTASGLARINELLSLEGNTAAKTTGAANAAESPAVVPSGPPATAKMTVAMVPRNPRLLICRRGPDSPPNQIVRVRSNENFVIGMAVEVIDAGTYWQVYGRLPRRKGRW